MTTTLKTLAFGLAFGTFALTGCEKPAADKAKDAKDKLGDAAKDAGGAIKDTARDAKDATKDALRDAKDATKDGAKAAGDTAKDAKDAMKDTLKGAGDSLKDAGKAVSDKVKEGVDAAKKLFRSPVDATVEKADKEITRLEGEEKKSSGDAQKAIHDKVEKAKGLRDKLKTKLSELGEAGGDKWEGLKTDILQMAKDLTTTLGL